MQGINIQMGIEAVNHIPAFIAYWDKEEICRFANAAFLEWHGKSQKEMIDVVSKREFLGPVYGEHDPYIKNVLQGSKQEFDSEFTSEDGNISYFHSMYTPHIEKGAVVGFTTYVTDVTDQVKAEFKLDASFKRNSIFVEQAPNAIAMFDKNMCYIAASKKWMEDYSLVGRDVIGKSHYDIFPEIGDDWKLKHQRCLKGEINQCDEAPFERADGTTQWITWDVRPWYLSKGVIGGLLIYTADITHIKEKDQSNKRIEAILDATNKVARIGTWELNINKKEVIWSKVTREIHEVSDDFEPVLSTGISFYKEGVSRETIARVVDESMTNNTDYDVELQLVTGKGNEKWVRVIGQSKFEDGKCVRHYGVFQDITKIKNSEINLNHANAELNVILNSGSVAIVGTDTKGLISHFNGGAEEMLQYSGAEMIGKQSPEIFHIKEELLCVGAELSTKLGRKISGFDVFAECAKNEEYSTREWTYTRKDGVELDVLLNIAPLRNHEGDVFGYLGVATDISERVENQRNLRFAKEKLELLTQRLTSQNMQLANFAHITSHNLRAPVTNLNSLLHFYHGADSDEEKSMLIEKFDTVVHHLTETLETLVETLKIRNEGIKKLEVINFDDVLDKTNEMLVGSIMESKAVIKADFSKAPAITFNRSYLESIVLNLITNGVKYRSPDRIPEINLKTEVVDNRVRFTFSDNGLGMDLKKHGKNLFGLHKTFHRNPEAKGVGLFLTKNHIEAMGGTISAESEVGKGMTFTIDF